MASNAPKSSQPCGLAHLSLCRFVCFCRPPLLCYACVCSCLALFFALTNWTSAQTLVLHQNTSSKTMRKSCEVDEESIAHQSHISKSSPVTPRAQEYVSQGFQCFRCFHKVLRMLSNGFKCSQKLSTMWLGSCVPVPTWLLLSFAFLVLCVCILVRIQPLL